VAVSDASRTIATPVATIDGRDRVRARRQISDMVSEWDAVGIVIGLPRSLDGTEGPAASRVRHEAQALSEVVSVPVVFHDERLSTVEAHRRLRESGLTDERSRRGTVDQAAAAVVLQAWIDAGR
jgi:putative Holliday junction resolvase